MASLQFGPVVAVRLWVPQVKPGVLPIETLAEINTAYPQTFIQEGVGTSLGLEPVGTIKIMTATKALYEAYQFLVRIVIPTANRVFEVTVAEVPFMLRPKAQGRIKCLIGRDILQFAVLTYNGPEDMFSLEFQALKTDTSGSKGERTQR